LQFYRALAAQALKEVAEQNVKTLADHLKDVTLFRKVGISKNYDVLRVEVQVSEAKSELMNADDNIYTARNKLAELLDHENDLRTLKGALPVLRADNLRPQDIAFNSERPDLKSLAEKSTAYALRASAANRFWVPKLSLIGQYQYYNNINDKLFDSNGAYRDAYLIGIALNWNIFDGMTSIAKSAEAHEQAIQNEKTLRIATLKAMQDLEYWRRKYVYFCSIYAARQEDIQKASESVRLAKEGRRAGTQTNTDLLDAETELFRAKASLVNAQLGSIEALIKIELATGRKIYDFN